MKRLNRAEIPRVAVKREERAANPQEPPESPVSSLLGPQNHATIILATIDPLIVKGSMFPLKIYFLS